MSNNDILDAQFQLNTSSFNPALRIWRAPNPRDRFVWDKERERFWLIEGSSEIRSMLVTN